VSLASDGVLYVPFSTASLGVQCARCQVSKLGFIKGRFRRHPAISARCAAVSVDWSEGLRKSKLLPAQFPSIVIQHLRALHRHEDLNRGRLAFVPVRKPLLDY
jgi:hypothetical protein